MPGNDRHAAKVEAIAAAIRDKVKHGEPVHISKGGVSHVVPIPGDPRFRTRPIDVSSLCEIIEIDPANATCTAEPGVTFAKVVEATLASGLLPAVVPELEGITLGGAVAGCSVESMSYRYGGFHDNAIEYEVVSGEGEVLTCSREREPLVFDMIHGSYGTLGLLSLLKFKLVPAKPYVRIEYRRLHTAEEFNAEMLARCRAADFDFIDGIIHGRDRFVLCLGRFTDASPYVSNYRRQNIYYKSTASREEDYLTTPDYCFRYDTECHWLSRTFPPLEWRWVRRLAGRWLLGSTNMIRNSKRLDRVFALKRRPDVVVDVFIPSRNFLEFCAWYARDFDYYPLWIVPYRIPVAYPWVAQELAAGMRDDLFIDCAVYGKPNSDPAKDWSEVLERKTYELSGIKTLISRNHYTPERFWEIYNRPNWEAVKRRLDPRGVFPDLCAKFHRVG